jgi:type IV pilus assembly protein PilB
MENKDLLREEKVIDLIGKEVPYKVLSVLAKEAADKYQMLVFEKGEKVLKVAMVDPENVEALNALRFIANKLGSEVEVFRVSEDGFASAFVGYDRAEVIVQKAQTDYIKKEKEIEAEKQQREKIKEDVKTIGSAPITKIVDVILQHAVLGGASDVHIEPQENELRVRYRVDGDLYESFKLSRDLTAALVSRVKIMSNLRIDEKRKPQDGRLQIVMEGRKDVIDVRVSSLPTAEGEKVVMRILEKQTGLDQFNNLGLIGRNQRIIEKGLDEPYGIILVTGPTGSGKSTTIFTCLRKINKLDTNIVTLEDPVEYKVPGVNHCQVNPEIGFTFASGLRSILRQDPDVIMVGEIRDKETAELAVHAALTGHLVLSTLHTNDALGAIPRMVDMGIEPFLLSSSLRVTVAQRLVRRVCNNCKKEVKPSDRIKQYVLNSLKLVPQEEIKERLPNFDPDNFFVWQGIGCSKCKNTGTKGRIAIYEVVECGTEMRRVIDDSLNASSLVNEFKRQGATLMREDGVMKALNGETTVEAVEEATTEDDINKEEEVADEEKSVEKVMVENET